MSSRESYRCGLEPRPLGWRVGAFFVGALLALAMGCGGSSSTGDATSADSTTPDGGGPVCYGPNSEYPSFDRQCTTGTDCAIGFHVTSCCGSVHAMGLKASEKAPFDALEPICQAQLPGCGCSSNTLEFDDGTSTLDKQNDVQVECRNQLCTTFVP